MWDTAGVAVCVEAGGQRYCRMVSDGAGGAIVVWTDNRHTYEDIYAQRINGSGETLWDDGGVAVCPVLAFKYRPRLISDGAGGAFVAWEDMRDGGRWVFAQRIDRDGAGQWDIEGIKVSGTRVTEGFLRVNPDGDGGAIIVWSRSSGAGWELFVRRIDADGSSPWSGETLVAEGDHVIEGFSSASTGDGSVTIAWDETVEAHPPHRLAAQRIGADGVVQWESGGVSLFESDADCDRPRVVPSDDGGCIVIWEAPSTSSTFWQYAQRISGEGAVLWRGGGVEVCYTATSQHGLVAASDGAGGAVSVWSEKRDPANFDVVAQRVDGNGDYQWTLTGLRVCSAGGDQVSSAVMPDGAGGAFVTWHDGRAGYHYDIYALRFDADGELPPVTRLLSYAAYGADRDIVVEWTLEEAGTHVRFSIWRAESYAGAFREIADPFITNDGLTFTFRDPFGYRGLEPATAYRYRLDVTDDEGSCTLFETEPVTTPPMAVTLYQNFPNPFNPRTAFYFYLPEPTRVILEVFDVSGRRILEVVDGWREEGHQEEPWDGCDAGGDPLPAGVYCCRLTTWMGSRARKFVIVR